MAMAKMNALVEDMETNVLVSSVSFKSILLHEFLGGNSHLWLVQKGYEFGF